MNIIDFDWDAIRVFIAVAEHQSVSKAAKDLSVSQPTAGRHISRLEDKLDLQLFDRRQTGFLLTEGGSVFLRQHRQCLKARLIFSVLSILKNSVLPIRFAE
jgi:DNA-binding transcriptional LysR family regulator